MMRRQEKVVKEDKEEKRDEIRHTWTWMRIGPQVDDRWSRGQYTRWSSKEERE